MIALTHVYVSYFFNQTADVLPPPLISVVFRLPLLLGSDPLLETYRCYRNSERPPVLLCCQLHSVYITSVFSKVFERLMWARLSRFMECSGVLPTTQFAYRKGLGTCDAYLCASIHCKSVLESAWARVKDSAD